MRAEVLSAVACLDTGRNVSIAFADALFMSRRAAIEAFLLSWDMGSSSSSEKAGNQNEKSKDEDSHDFLKLEIIIINLSDKTCLNKNYDFNKIYILFKTDY